MNRPKKFPKAKHIFLIIIPLLILFCSIGLRISESGLLTEIQLRVFDRLQRMEPRRYEEIAVRIVDIDESSLARYGQWPWPRTLVARMIENLTQAGAAAIALDIVFAEPDRSSPGEVIRVWPQNIAQELREEIQNLPDHDEVLAKTIENSPVITSFSLTHIANDGAPFLKAGVAFAGDDPAKDFAPFSGAITSLEGFEKTAKGNGAFNVIAERDGIIRRVPLFFRLREKLYPSLMAEAVRVAAKASTYIIKSSGASGETGFGAHTGINHVKIGPHTVPTDSEGRIWLYDAGPVEERTISADQILDKSFDKSKIAGHVVFVGTSAAGLKDLRATPLNPVAAGVEVHAQLAEQILLGQYLIRPDWAPGAEMVYLAVLGLFLVLILPWIGAAFSAFVGILTATVIFGFSWYAYRSLHLLLDPVYPSLACLLIYLCSSLLNYLRTEAEKRQVRNAFSRYMSPDMVKRLTENPELLKLGGETRNMSILFADIRDFTSISEKLNASEVTQFINRFLTPMTEIILKKHGTIDKYMGDCIMAFWNAPLEDPHHARNACEAALAMRNHLVEWNRKASTPIKIGIGLNTGECCVGNLGSDQRFDYSVVGDEVNLASRLEGLSKIYGVDIVLGPNTQSKVTDFSALELDLIRVRGKNVPAHVFCLIGPPSLNQNRDFTMLRECHQKMLTAFRSQDWKKAIEFLEECGKFHPSVDLGPLYAVYRERIATYKEKPPIPDWDGIFVATTK